jgi:hypothetical protein
MSQDFLKSLLGTSQPEHASEPLPSREEVLDAVTSTYERNSSQLSEQLKLAESHAGQLERLARILREDPEKILDEPELMDSYPAPENLRQLAKEVYAVRINLVPLELVLRAAGELPK